MDRFRSTGGRALDAVLVCGAAFWGFVAAIIAIVAFDKLFGSRFLPLILLFVLAMPLIPVAAIAMSGDHRLRRYLPLGGVLCGALIATRALSPHIGSALFGACVGAALVQAILATSPDAARRARALDEGTTDRRLALATFVLVATVGIRPAFVKPSSIRIWLPSLLAISIVFALLFAMEAVRYVRLRRVYRGADPELHVGSVSPEAPPLFHDLDIERAFRAGSARNEYRVAEGHAICAVPASFAAVAARLLPRLALAAAGTGLSLWALFHAHPW